MILFTTVMGFDILMFGVKMRELWKSLVPDPKKISISDGLFALPGWIVLAMIGLLISVGWLFVALDDATKP